MSKKDKLELYVHIPFCQQKCKYCDFVSGPADEETKQRYMEALHKEIRLHAEEYKNCSVPTIYIGGGTPSVLRGEVIAELIELLYECFSIENEAEITVECNPGTLNPEKLKQYKQAGVNRLSLGLQSAVDFELKMLGRIHTFFDFLECYDIVRRAGFDNVNVDIMSELPMQGLDKLEYTLKKVTELEPEHISIYSLILEKGTPFYDSFFRDQRRMKNGDTPLWLADEELEVEMNRLTVRLMEACGYEHYEISNYARAGRECRHNIGYWRRVHYLGLGLGSSSFIGNERYQNTANLEDYIKGDYEKYRWEYLTRRDQIEEYMFLGFRLMQGVSKEDFYRCFHEEMTEVYAKEIDRMMSKGLLQWEGDYLNLTQNGIIISNFVMTQFLEPEPPRFLNIKKLKKAIDKKIW